MSGLEVAGVVLAVLPVLFKAIDLSRTGFDRKRIYVDKLARAILFNHQMLKEIIRPLLHKSGCKDALRLNEDPLAYLESESVREHILDYLGPENDAAFKSELDKSCDIVKEIARIIAGLVPTLKYPSDDLLEIIKANQDTSSNKPKLSQRLKLIFGAKQITEAVKELDSTIKALVNFVEIIASTRQPIEGSLSRKAVRLAKALRKVRDSTSSLYIAILPNWTAACHIKHEAKLFLEDRVDPTDMLGGARKDSSAPILNFRVIFAASVGEGQTLRHETVVQVLRNDVDDNLGIPPVCRSPASPKITIISPETTSLKPAVTLVNGICRSIEAATQGRRHFTFVLSGNQQRMGMISADKCMFTQCPHASSISLKALLTFTSKSRDTMFPLRDRMLLALRLASNLLQLSETQWLQNTLSKDVIYFLSASADEGEDTVRDHAYVDFGRPFVSLTFDHASMSAHPPQNVEPKVALLELGILFLEIWHHTTFETQFSLAGELTGYRKRVELAMEWLNDISDPLPELYDKAVSHCISGNNAGETRFHDWEDKRLWSAVCEDIIEPLSRNCNQWRRRN